MQHEQICYMTSCEFDEKWAKHPKFVAQSRPRLYFLQHPFSTRDKSFVVRQGWKMQNIYPKLETQQTCTTSQGFLYLMFHRL